ncbi:MAG: hypothetical protein P4L76_03240 [Beijerinckiaceae bacterium]|nr:hypothetical protein [Beijerinckiaceae bacterium]
MKLNIVFAGTFFALACLPIGAQAQGLVNGAREGAHEGDRAAGPVGAVVGGAIGAGVGTVNGALGIRPGYYHHHRCYYNSFGHRRCRY